MFASEAGGVKSWGGGVGGDRGRFGGWPALHPASAITDKMRERKRWNDNEDSAPNIAAESGECLARGSSEYVAIRAQPARPGYRCAF